MFGKKKKGDLGNIVFPEYPLKKGKDKELPPLDIPKFSKADKSDKSKLPDLPELKLPAFSQTKKPEQVKKLPEPKPSSSLEKEISKEISKYAPPEVAKQKLEIKKPAPVFKKPEIKAMPVPVVKMPEKKPEVKQIVKPIAPKPAFKKPEIRQVAKPMPLVKPVEISHPIKHMFSKQDIKPIVIKPKLKQPMILQPSKVAKYEAHARKMMAKAKHIVKPVHHVKRHAIKIKHLHPVKLHKIKHEKARHPKVKQVYRALKHVTVKGPVKPKDKLTLKRIGIHVSDIAKQLSKYKSDSVTYSNFNSLRKTVEKEVASIKKMYHEFDSVQRDFKRTQLAFHKSKSEFENDLAKARSKLQDEFNEASKNIHHQLELARHSFSKHTEDSKKSFHSNIESTKTFTSKEVDEARKIMEKQLEDARKSMVAKQDAMLEKVDSKLAKLSSDNQELMKDLGRLSILDSKLNSKLDVSVYNQLVRKINELESNVEVNEGKLDNDLKVTVDYLRKLAEAFDNSIKTRQAITDRILYHEKVMQELYNMMKNKPKLDMNQYLEEYANEPPENPENDYMQDSTQEEAQEVEDMLSSNDEEPLS